MNIKPEYFNGRAVIPAAYIDREQAWAKHWALELYLDRLLHIVGYHLGAGSMPHELVYVDCFAGPWQAPGEHIDATSVAISLRKLNETRKHLGRNGRMAPRFRALFIERDLEAFERLNQFVASNKGSIEATCMAGEFAALVPRIKKWCGGNAFAFFFVDPKGYQDVGKSTLGPLLSMPYSEFLINFMSSFVVRGESQQVLAGLMDDLLGGFQAVAGEADGLDRESRVARAYAAHMKSLNVCQHRCAPRSYTLPILDPRKDRTKYHLVYLTCNPKGILEFAEASEKAMSLQCDVAGQVRHEYRQARTKQDDLFDAPIAPAPLKPEIDMKEVWLNLLQDGGVKKIDQATAATLLESNNTFPGALQSALKQLIQDGVVINLDEKRRRTKNAVNWDKEERLQLASDTKGI